jgi:glucose/arabinose dehydrogenase
MYVSIGSSCNVCIEEDGRRAALMRFRPDGSGGEVFATGLRNSVGFDWRPQDGQIYATDNGRDLLGDDFPPCELNRVVRGGFYGWPVANGDRVPDPDFGKGQEAASGHRFRSSTPSGPTTPLGMTFLRGEGVPTRIAARPWWRPRLLEPEAEGLQGRVITGGRRGSRRTS